VSVGYREWLMAKLAWIPNYTPRETFYIPVGEGSKGNLTILLELVEGEMLSIKPLVRGGF
jgi:hypothetical protein